MIVTQVSVDNFFARSVGGKSSFVEKRVGNGCVDGGELTWVFRYEKRRIQKWMRLRGCDVLELTNANP